MVTTRGANGIREPSTPYRPPPSTKAPATSVGSKVAGARKASSSTRETPARKRKSPNTHTQQTPPPKLRFNLQMEIEAEAWGELKSPGASVHPNDGWLFSDLPIILRRGPVKNHVDTIRVGMGPRSEDDEEEKTVELPEGYMSKRFGGLDAPPSDEDDWATDYESDGDVPMRLLMSPPKPTPKNNVQYEQWEEKLNYGTPMMSDTRSVHSYPDYLTMREDRDKVELKAALDFETEKLGEEAEEIERARHPELYDGYYEASDSGMTYNHEDEDEAEALKAERLLSPRHEYNTWLGTSQSNATSESAGNDLSAGWPPRKKSKLMDTTEKELDMESLYISPEDEKEHERDGENKDKPATPRLISSSDPSEWRFGFTELPTPHVIETVPLKMSFGDNLPPSLGLFTFESPRAPSCRRMAQFATPPHSNRGSASPIHGMHVDLDRDAFSPSPTGLLVDDYQSSSPPFTPANAIPLWNHIMSQHFPGHTKHLCKSGRSPQAELEYTRNNSGFNTSLTDELDRMYPRKKKPIKEDAVMPRTGRRAPVTEKWGDFVLAEDSTTTKGRSRTHLQSWSSA